MKNRWVLVLGGALFWMNVSPSLGQTIKIQDKLAQQDKDAAMNGDQAIAMATNIADQIFDQNAAVSAYQTAKDPWGNPLRVTLNVSADGMKILDVIFVDMPQRMCRNMIGGNWGPKLSRLYSDGARIGQGVTGCVNAKNDLKAEYISSTVNPLPPKKKIGKME